MTYNELKEKVKECQRLPIALESLESYYQVDNLLIEEIDHLQKNRVELDISDCEIEQLYELRNDLDKHIALAVLLEGKDYKKFASSLIGYSRTIEAHYAHYAEEKELEAEVRDLMEFAYSPSQKKIFQDLHQRVLKVKNRKHEIADNLNPSISEFLKNRIEKDYKIWHELSDAFILWQDKTLVVPLECR